MSNSLVVTEVNVGVGRLYKLVTMEPEILEVLSCNVVGDFLCGLEREDAMCLFTQQPSMPVHLRRVLIRALQNRAGGSSITKISKLIKQRIVADRCVTSKLKS